MNTEYKIDFDMFTALEIIKIIEFFQLIEKTKTSNVKSEVLISKFQEYRSVLRNKTLEKKYDKMLYEKSKVSIHEVMKKLI